jgi:hypothetical protein
MRTVSTLHSLYMHCAFTLCPHCTHPVYPLHSHCIHPVSTLRTHCTSMYSVLTIFAHLGPALRAH